jgi:hypothetical protein
MKPASPVTDVVDWFFADGNGNMNILEDYSAPDGTGSSGFNDTYQIESSGRGNGQRQPGGSPLQRSIKPAVFCFR